MWAQNRPTALWHPAEGLRGKACELWTGRGQDLELALVHNDIDSHRARIPGCTATCVWCASVLFDVPSATSRKTCTDVTMACARPDRDPEMLALYHIPPLGPARGPFQRSRGAGVVPRGVVLNPPLIRTTPLGTQERTCAARARPRSFDHLLSPARLVARSRPATTLASESASWTDGFMPRAAPMALEAFASLRFAWY